MRRCKAMIEGRVLGCAIVSEPDPELFELEPGDIHLAYDLGPATGG